MEILVQRKNKTKFNYSPIIPRNIDIVKQIK
nr:MAG TPA: hypothetical protein [Caudoviricetes sp.]